MSPHKPRPMDEYVTKAGFLLVASRQLAQSFTLSRHFTTPKLLRKQKKIKTISFARTGKRGGETRGTKGGERTVREDNSKVCRLTCRSFFFLFCFYVSSLHPFDHLSRVWDRYLLCSHRDIQQWGLWDPLRLLLDERSGVVGVYRTDRIRSDF